MRRIVSIGICILFTSCMSAQADSCQNLKVEEFFIAYHSSSNPILIDTRSVKEFAMERIPGAVLAESRVVLLAMTDSLDSDHPIFLYCENDQRSRVACSLLLQEGFKNVSTLVGGLIEWQNVGYETDHKRIRKKPD